MEGKGRPSSYKTITIEKKLQILLETDQPDSTIRGVARKHGISPSSIHDWRKNRDKLQDKELVKHVKSRKNVLHSTQRNLFPEMEMILASWIIDQRQMGLAVTPMMTKDKAKSILHEVDPEAKFTASTGWFQKFCKRHHFTLRRSSTLNQTDPEDLDEKVVRFLLHFKKIKARFPVA